MSEEESILQEVVEQIEEKDAAVSSKMETTEPVGDKLSPTVEDSSVVEDEEPKERVYTDMEQYALKYKWDPNGNKTAEEFVDYDHRLWRNKFNTVVNSHNKLLDLLDKERQTENTKKVEQLFEAAETYLNNDDLENAKIYFNAAKAEQGKSKEAKPVFSEHKISEEKTSIEDFAQRNRGLLTNPEIFKYADMQITMLRQTNPDTPLEDILEITEQNLKTKYKDVIAPVKTIAPAAKVLSNNKTVDKVTYSLNDIPKENKPLFDFAVKQGYVKNVKEFASWMRKDNPSFKLRGEK